MSGPIETHDILLRLIDGSVILDVGCGWGRIGYFILTNWNYSQISDATKTQKPDYIVGIDVFGPSLKRLKKHNIYDDIVMCDAENLPFRSHSFEVVSASEIVEHMSKEEALSLLKELERVSGKTVLVTTPHYPGHRGGVREIEGFNPYEHHIGSVSFKEFKALGYDIYGRGFGVAYRLSYSSKVGSRYPKVVVFIGELLSSLSVLFPQFASIYIAKKHILLKS